MDAQARKKTADEKLQLLNKLLVGIKSGLETVSRVDLYLFFQKYIFVGDNEAICWGTIRLSSN